MPFTADLYYQVHEKTNQSELPILLIHGAGGHHLFWPTELRRLAGWRVYAIDLPGHGKSTAASCSSIQEFSQAIIQWLDALQLPRILLAGHSMGGAIAMQTTLETPGRVSGLVLLGSGARLRVSPDLLALTSRSDTFHQAVQIVTSWSFGPLVAPHFVALATQRMAQTRPEVLYTDFLACDSFDIRSRLAEITCPVLILTGDLDNMVPLQYAKYLAEHLLSSRLEVIPSAGHMVMLENPAATAQHLLDWLSQFSDQRSVTSA